MLASAPCRALLLLSPLLLLVVMQSAVLSSAFRSPFASSLRRFSQYRLKGVLATSYSPLSPFTSKKYNRHLSKNVHHFNFGYSRVFSTKSKRVKDRDVPLLPVFFSHVRMKDLPRAKETYDQILASHPGHTHHRKNMLTALLSVCEKSDHLEFAQQLLKDLKLAELPVTESNLNSVIKCASDRGDIELAKQYLREIVENDYVVRHRDTFPILRAISNSTALNSSFEALNEASLLKIYDLYPRPEELEVILASGVRTGAIRDPIFRDELSRFISVINSTYSAIDHITAIRIHQAVQDGILSSEDEKSIDFLKHVYQKGILVERASDITGKILPLEPFVLADCVAERASVIGHSEEELLRLRNESLLNLESHTGKKKKTKKMREVRDTSPDIVEKICNEIPQLENIANKHNIPKQKVDIYEVLSKDTPRIGRSNIIPIRTDGIFNIIKNNHSVVTDVCPHNDSNMPSIPPSTIQYFIPKAAVGRSTAVSTAPRNSPPKSDLSPRQHSQCRLVEISKETLSCPNCGDKLRHIAMDEDDVKHAKSVLTSLTAEASNIAGKKLEAFDKWLAQQDDFDFVIDAANVAYYNQNHKNGKFSYQQVELVFNALKKSGVISNPRILVLVPESYLQRNRYNAVTRKRTAMSDDDHRIISRFEKENCLYKVPRHINDDWFVIYATLCGKRSKPQSDCVSTGEDWRPTYAVSNDLSRDHKLSFLSPRPFFRWRSTQVVFFDFKKSIHEKNAHIKQDVTLTFPDTISREFQLSDSNSSRWHLPIDDRQSWLCLNI